MRYSKVRKLSSSGSKTSGVPLNNPERVRGGKKSGDVEEQLETQNGGEEEKGVIKWVKEVRMFVGESGAEALHWQRGQTGQIEELRYTCWRGLQKKSQCWKIGDPQEKQRRIKEDGSRSESCLDN